jgi:hypothetical protein
MMIEYRGFHPSLRVDNIDLDIRRPKVVMVEDDSIVLEAKIESGPWDGEQLRIVYQGDIGIEDGKLLGSIERVIALSGGEQVFEVVFDEAVELGEVLKNGWRHARDDDDDDGETEEEEEEEEAGDHHDGSWNHDDRDLEVLLDVKKLLRLVADEGYESRGGKGSDKLRGGDGDDVLHGRRGRDKLFGSEGDDELDGGDGKDSIHGGSGGDEIHGGGGRDKLYGGSGNDRIEGGGGRDLMEGGTGTDIFVFGALDDLGLKQDRDIIRKFESGLDMLDLAGVDADRTSDGNQAFDYIGTGGFSGEAGELRYKRGMLMGDGDGDGASDFHIKCKGADLSGDDFLL